MTTPSTTPPENEKPQQTSWDHARDVVITVVACLILVAFAILVIGMFQKLTAAENEWTRAIYLYTGVEAIVFAAAGFLFGREVNRQRAENAEKAATAEGIKTDVAQARLFSMQALVEKANAGGRAALFTIQAKINSAESRSAGANASLADLKELREIVQGLLA